MSEEKNPNQEKRKYNKKRDHALESFLNEELVLKNDKEFIVRKKDGTYSRIYREEYSGWTYVQTYRVVKDQMGQNIKEDVYQNVFDNTGKGKLPHEIA